jgi:hypothetical protein
LVALRRASLDAFMVGVAVSRGSAAKDAMRLRELPSELPLTLNTWSRAERLCPLAQADGARVPKEVYSLGNLLQAEILERELLWGVAHVESLHDGVPVWPRGDGNVDLWIGLRKRNQTLLEKLPVETRGMGV